MFRRVVDCSHAGYPSSLGGVTVTQHVHQFVPKQPVALNRARRVPAAPNTMWLPIEYPAAPSASADRAASPSLWMRMRLKSQFGTPSRCPTVLPNRSPARAMT